MTVIKKTIGRLPVLIGEYDSTRSYGKKNRVTLFGSEFESKHDNNNTAPATWDGSETVTFNEVDWQVISNGTSAWIAGNDKPAASEDFPYNGMGRIILKKNMVNIAEEGEEPNIVNLLTQSAFEDSDENPLTNTIFVIKYDFTLGEDITVPADCVLEFEGGSISAGNGENMDTITGNNTSIQAGLAKIFNTDITLSGSWKITKAYVEWFGAKGDGTTDNYSSIQKTIDTFIDSTICLTNGVYCVSDTIKTVFRKAHPTCYYISSNSVLKAASAMNTLFIYGDTYDYTETENYDTYTGFAKIYGGGTFDGNYLVDTVVRIKHQQRIHVSDICVKNGNSIIYYVGGSDARSVEGRHEFLKLADLRGNATLIHAAANDAMFSNSSGYGGKVGVRNSGGLARFSELHLCTYSGLSIKDTIGFDDYSGTSKYSKCYADTYETSFKVHGSGISIENCFAYSYLDHTWSTWSSDLSPVIINLRECQVPCAITIDNFDTTTFFENLPETIMIAQNQQAIDFRQINITNPVPRKSLLKKETIYKDIAYRDKQFTVINKPAKTSTVLPKDYICIGEVLYQANWKITDVNIKLCDVINYYYLGELHFKYSYGNSASEVFEYKNEKFDTISNVDIFIEPKPSAREDLEGVNYYKRKIYVKMFDSDLYLTVQASGFGYKGCFIPYYNDPLEGFDALPDIGAEYIQATVVGQ